MNAAGCLLVIGGAVMGFLLGCFLTAASMALSGGGHSHNDMFTFVAMAFLWAIVGAVVTPILTVRIVRLREARRVARLNGDPEIPYPKERLWYLAGSFVAAFCSLTIFYFADAILDLIQIGVIFGGAAGVLALVLFVASVRRPWHVSKETPAGRTTSGGA
jgi:prolipoprotein diacylglyceryltransferase